MGEMADYFLQDVFQDESDRELYTYGSMGQQDAHDRGYVDSLGRELEGIDDAWDRTGFLK